MAATGPTVAAIIGTLAVPIGYLQVRSTRAAQARAQLEGSLSARLGDTSLFAPRARYLGYDVDLINRRAESEVLLRHVKAGRSVIAIEGIAGVGKTALAARLCRQVRGRTIRWVFCDEKGDSFTLGTLAEALTSDVDSRSTVRLRAAVMRGANASDLIDSVIDLLAAQRLLLVFDNFHTVTDSDINELLTGSDTARRPRR